jgi:UDP-N-acetylglucosamine:LPS N-acetylglucosamine transferase
MTTKSELKPECEGLCRALDLPMPDFYVVPEANRWDKIRLVRSLLKIVWVVLRLRPDVVVTTGAAPGYFAVRVASLIGSRTVWIDSIANAEELSLSGKKAGRFVDLWLTQWPDVSGPEGPQYKGSVL